MLCIMEEIPCDPEILDRLSATPHDPRPGRVRAVLARLRPTDQAIVEACLIEGLGSRAAAREVGVSRPAVQQRLTILRPRLRRLLLAALAWAALAGCGEGPNGAFAWWHGAQHPVRVAIDGTMSPECIEAAWAAVQDWRGRGVWYLDPRITAPPSNGDLRDPPVGSILVAHREDLSEVVDDVVERQVEAAGVDSFVRRIRRAAVISVRCEAHLFAHGLGHALGLLDSYDEHTPALMRWDAGNRPEWRHLVTQAEIDWVTQ